MTKCKNCGTEEQGYATLLDKRGYCYNPYCQSCSYDEVEQQNSRLQSELDKQIKDNRKLVKALKEIRNWLHNEFTSGWKKIGKEYFFLMEPDWAQTNYNDVVNTLKEVGEEE